MSIRHDSDGFVYRLGEVIAFSVGRIDGRLPGSELLPDQEETTPDPAKPQGLTIRQVAMTSIQNDTAWDAG
ncbi:MAG: hypothetical protein OEY86_21040 [Nitrospira sp.]|nr:hypothetical protein [Nitrospira sp.]